VDTGEGFWDDDFEVLERGGFVDLVGGGEVIWGVVGDEI
jgi:hypothetical protein